MKHVLILFGFVFIQNMYAQTCDSLFVASLKEFDNSNYDASILLVNRCISECAPHEKYYLHQAKCYNSIKNFAATITSLSEAIRINDSCIDAYALRAQIYLDQSHYFNAIENYEKIISLLKNPHVFKDIYHVNLSKAYNNTQQYQKTYDLLFPIYEQMTFNLGANVNLAVSCMQLQKIEEAEQFLNRCVELDPTFTGGLVNMGYLYITLKEYEKAIEYFNKALLVNPREPYALNNRGFAHYCMQNYESALRDINESLSILPDNSYAYKNRGLVYLKTGLVKEACVEFEKAIRIGYTSMYGNEVIDLQNEFCK